MLPKAQPGLVIAYSYLWAREHQLGAEEGRKERPCAIVAARQIIEGKEVVTVVPVTHTPPADPGTALEIPTAIKQHLGLDDQRSWIMVSETNDLIWPGPDLRPIPGKKPATYAYGMLPPKFFNRLRETILEAFLRHRVKSVPRTD